MFENIENFNFFLGELLLSLRVSAERKTAVGICKKTVDAEF